MYNDEGANVQLCQSVRGQMSTHIIFQKGANVRGDMSYTLNLRVRSVFVCLQNTTKIVGIYIHLKNYSFHTVWRHSARVPSNE